MTRDELINLIEGEGYEYECDQEIVYQQIEERWWLQSHWEIDEEFPRVTLKRALIFSNHNAKNRRKECHIAVDDEIADDDILDFILELLNGREESEEEQAEIDEEAQRIMDEKPDINPITRHLDDHVAPLYCVYDGQVNPQGAYIELDCRTGDLRADYSGEIGNAVPADVFHDLVIRWSIPAESLGGSIIALFEDETFLGNMQKVLNGFEERWNGNNYVGHFTDEAQEIIDDYHRAPEMGNWPLDVAEVYPVEDYLFHECTLDEFWEHQTLDEAVNLIEVNRDSDHHVDGDIREALLDKAEELFNDDPEELNDVHVDTLVEEGRITRDQAELWEKRTAYGAICDDLPEYVFERITVEEDEEIIVRCDLVESSANVQWWSKEDPERGWESLPIQRAELDLGRSLLDVAHEYLDEQ